MRLAKSSVFPCLDKVPFWLRPAAATAMTTERQAFGGQVPEPGMGRGCRVGALLDAGGGVLYVLRPGLQPPRRELHDVFACPLEELNAGGGVLYVLRPGLQPPPAPTLLQNVTVGTALEPL